VPDAERRRIGKVVHDDRGTASVKWLDAPADYQRPVLELAGDSPPAPPARKPEESFNPYARGATRGATRGTAPGTRSTATNTSPRTDLRKLSEWIKMMREIEERKRNGGDQD
jgi:hypothetical protein